MLPARSPLVAPLVILSLLAVAPPAQAAVISEFRLRGPSGAQDEFVEVYNDSDSPTTVASSDGSSGWSVAASDGVVRFVIPNGTTIPARGHYLGANSAAYSLGATTPANATWTTDIPDNAGVALFSTSNPAHFALANRLDAVGATTEANTLYKTGTGYPALTPFSIDDAWTRDLRPGLPKNTQNNSADLFFVDTNGTNAGGGQRLGAPGPENLASPIVGRGDIAVQPLDPSVPVSSAPNFDRNFTSDPANNATFGRVTLRRRLVNLTDTPITSLTLRVADLTTFPAPSGVADLRPQTSTGTTIYTSGGIRAVAGTTLQAPPSQVNGGGFNSVMVVSGVSPSQPLNPRTAIDVQVQMGIQQTGQIRFCAQVGSVPGANGFLDFTGVTDSGAAPASQCTAPFTPQARLTVPAQGFPDVAQGEVGPAVSIPISNPGSAGVPVSAVTTGGDFLIGDDPCTGTTVPGGGTCRVTVRFAPTATGARTGSLTVTSPFVSTAVGALSGNGTAPPAPQTITVNVPTPPPVITCTVGATAKQSRLSTGRLTATATCTGGVIAGVGGRVTIAGRPAGSLGGVSSRLVANRPAKLAPTLSRTLRGKVLSALRRKKRVAVTLNLQGTDAAARNVNATATITIRRA